MLLGGGGVQDALASLGAHPDDWVIKCAIAKRAQQMDVAQKEALLKAEAALIGNRVAEVMAKVLSSMLR